MLGSQIAFRQLDHARAAALFGTADFVVCQTDRGSPRYNCRPITVPRRSSVHAFPQASSENQGNHHAGGPWPASSEQMAEWAVEKDRYQLTRGMAISQCKEKIARAMRLEHLKDRK